jgi:hypothetical protein
MELFDWYLEDEDFLLIIFKLLTFHNSSLITITCMSESYGTMQGSNFTKALNAIAVVRLFAIESEGNLNWKMH